MKDGEDGSSATVDIVTSWNSTLSDAKVPSEKLTKNSLDNKVDKVTGKGLSSNDFTNSYKSAIDGLSTVATSGDYDDLTDKPTIPSKFSDLTNDSDFIEKSNTSGLIKNDGTIDTTSYSTFSGSYNDLSNKPTIPSKISDLTNDSGFITSSAISGMLTTSDVVDNLTSTSATAPLSAKQGKVLNDMIGSAITYIVGSGN